MRTWADSVLTQPTCTEIGVHASYSYSIHEHSLGLDTRQPNVAGVTYDNFWCSPNIGHHTLLTTEPVNMNVCALFFGRGSESCTCYCAERAHCCTNWTREQLRDNTWMYMWADRLCFNQCTRYPLLSLVSMISFWTCLQVYVCSGSMGRGGDGQKNHRTWWRYQWFLRHCPEQQFTTSFSKKFMYKCALCVCWVNAGLSIDTIPMECVDEMDTCISWFNAFFHPAHTMDPPGGWPSHQPLNWSWRSEVHHTILTLMATLSELTLLLLSPLSQALGHSWVLHTTDSAADCCDTGCDLHSTV